MLVLYSVGDNYSPNSFNYNALQTLNSFKNLVNVNSNLDVILTDREKDVLRLITEGKSNVEIAKDLIISVHTAKAHVCSILQKLCVNDRVQAAVKAVRKNLV